VPICPQSGDELGVDVFSQITAEHGSGDSAQKAGQAACRIGPSSFVRLVGRRFAHATILARQRTARIPAGVISDFRLRRAQSSRSADFGSGIWPQLVFNPKSKIANPKSGSLVVQASRLHAAVGAAQCRCSRDGRTTNRQGIGSARIRSTGRGGVCSVNSERGSDVVKSAEPGG